MFEELLGGRQRVNPTIEAARAGDPWARTYLLILLAHVEPNTPAFAALSDWYMEELRQIAERYRAAVASGSLPPQEMKTIQAEALAALGLPKRGRGAKEAHPLAKRIAASLLERAADKKARENLGSDNLAVRKSPKAHALDDVGLELPKRVQGDSVRRRTSRLKGKP